MNIQIVDKQAIEQAFEEMHDAMRKACHVEGLPYMECLPSLKGYGLMQVSWESFTKAYFQKVREACKLGNVTYVMI